MVREFQRVVGDEAREQCRAILGGDDPELVVACVGGGSNAIGTFAGFLDTDAPSSSASKPAGSGSRAGQHGAAVSRGVPGVLHGARSLYLQDEDGQIVEAHSISAGLDYPGVGPEHAQLAADGPGALRVRRPTTRRIAGFQLLSVTEGIVPALEPAHAIGWLAREAGRVGAVGIDGARHACRAGATRTPRRSPSAAWARSSGDATVTLEARLRARREAGRQAARAVRHRRPRRRVARRRARRRRRRRRRDRDRHPVLRPGDGRASPSRRRRSRRSDHGATPHSA